MDQFGVYLLSAIIVVILVVVVFPLMLWGWRGRKRRQAGLPAAPTVPDEVGPPVSQTGILYVATTAAGDPLDRLTLPSLAFRGRGRLLLWPTGVGIDVDGERTVFLPRDALRAAGTSTWTIDKAVERGGLVRIDWRLPTAEGGIEVESYLRVLDADDRDPLLDALQSLIPATTSHTEDHRTEGDA